MNASKENATAAKEKFLEIIESSPSLDTTFRKQIQFVSEFLDHAARKLPTEAAYSRAALPKKERQAITAKKVKKTIAQVQERLTERKRRHTVKK